jgi:hypothetical protein
MCRRKLLVLVLCFLVGCNGKGIHGIPLLHPDPSVASLPFTATLNKGSFRISISSIPGRTDAVKVQAQMNSSSEEWIQEGCSTKELKDGRETYRVIFIQMDSTADVVRQVKLSIMYKFGG